MSSQSVDVRIILIEFNLILPAFHGSLERVIQQGDYPILNRQSGYSRIGKEGTGASMLPDQNRKPSYINLGSS
jgi:hypothetical protein